MRELSRPENEVIGKTSPRPVSEEALTSSHSEQQKKGYCPSCAAVAFSTVGRKMNRGARITHIIVVNLSLASLVAASMLLFATG